ncbi:UNVERIFIED_CONTAM: hypothetical protein PYX00_007918 [Menopon gallinae]|uniref:Gag protein n=1 Tax=Menopon gallinae TaxID=328185 RepID=A0AAW2HL45_9NEOP
MIDKLIPVFDGSKHALEYFLDSVDRAIMFAPESLHEFVFALIKSKIRGKGYELIKHREFVKWRELKEFLLHALRERKTLFAYQAELNGAYQKRDQNVGEFAKYIDKLCHKMYLIINSDDDLSQAEKEANIKALNKTALYVFLAGLRRNIGIIVKSQKPHSLLEAIELAEKEEAEIRNFNNRNLEGGPQGNVYKTYYLERRKKPEIRKVPSGTRGKEVPSSSNGPGAQRPYCSKCRKTGHTKGTCQERPPMECLFCKRKGHGIKECQYKVAWEAHEAHRKVQNEEKKKSQNKEKEKSRTDELKRVSELTFAKGKDKHPDDLPYPRRDRQSRYQSDIESDSDCSLDFARKCFINSPLTEDSSSSDLN